MSQLALAYRPAYLGHEAWLVALEALRGAVAYLGPKEVMFELDISKSTLSESLNEQNHKRWAGEWTYIVLAMLDARHEDAGDRHAKAILDALASVSTRYIVDEVRDLTPEEQLAGFRRELQAMGDVGKQAIARVMRRSKR